MGPEWQLSEQPLIAQLEAMGWSYIKGSLDNPAATGRESFAEVVQREVLRRGRRGPKHLGFAKGVAPLSSALQCFRGPRTPG